LVIGAYPKHFGNIYYYCCCYFITGENVYSAGGVADFNGRIGGLGILQLNRGNRQVIIL
jgi:hypothetical protein